MKKFALYYNTSRIKSETYSIKFTFQLLVGIIQRGIEHIGKNATQKACEAVKNIYFKFNSEDGVREFNKREYLLDQPKAKLYRIAKECGFTKYKKLALWSLVSKIAS